MKKTIVRTVSTKLGEEIGDFERINFDENNEILILPTKEEISRAASELERSTHFRSNIAAQKTKRLPKKKIEEDKGFRLTASQKQLQLGAKRKRKDAKHAAFKLATRRVDQERAKPKGAQKSTTQIREEVIEETGVEIQSVSTINDYVQKGMVDMTPLKVGKPSKLPQYILKALSSIHLASVRIMQLTGRNKTYHSAKNLTNTLKLCLKKNEYNLELPGANWVLQKIREETADKLGGTASSKDHVEANRQKWLTEANLRRWASAEEEFGIESDLMYRNEEGKACWKDGVADRIVNFDETSISVDTSEMSRGGRPTVYFTDPGEPDCGIAGFKSSFRCTLVLAITASGKMLPPHLQFCKDTKKENASVCFSWINGLHLFVDPENPEGQVHATYSFNEKGSMDTEALKSYYGAYHGMMGVQNFDLLTRFLIL